MTLEKLLAQATARHRASRCSRLASWLEVGDGTWAIIVTEASFAGGETMVDIKRYNAGSPSPVVAAGIAAAQARADQALLTSFGAAWEDAWHECALLSLVCDAGEELLLRCQARPRTAARALEVLEDSCLRVRARLAAASSEFPRLVAEVRAICRHPVALAA